MDYTDGTGFCDRPAPFRQSRLNLYICRRNVYHFGKSTLGKTSISSGGLATSVTWMTTASPRYCYIASYPQVNAHLTDQALLRPAEGVSQALWHSPWDEPAKDSVIWRSLVKSKVSDFEKKKNHPNLVQPPQHTTSQLQQTFQGKDQTH